MELSGPRICIGCGVEVLHLLLMEMDQKGFLTKLAPHLVFWVSAAVFYRNLRQRIDGVTPKLHGYRAQMSQNGLQNV